MGVLRWCTYGEDHEEKCRWHLTDLHTTQRCPRFKDFLCEHRYYSWYDLSNEEEVVLGLSYPRVLGYKVKFLCQNPFIKGSLPHKYLENDTLE